MNTLLRETVDVPEHLIWKPLTSTEQITPSALAFQGTSGLWMVEVFPALTGNLVAKGTELNVGSNHICIVMPQTLRPLCCQPPHPYL
jgi:hypothetical protein